MNFFSKSAGYGYPVVAPYGGEDVGHSQGKRHFMNPNKPVNNSLFSPEFSVLNVPMPSNETDLYRQMEMA
jgi:hypothetical protein